MPIFDCADKCLQDLENIKNGSVRRPIAFQHFLVNFPVFITEVEMCMQEKCNRPKYKNKVILCLTQIKKILPMLQNLIKENEEQGTKEKVWYLCERLQWCISELRRVVGGEVEVQNADEDISSAFAHHIDYALQLLSIHQGIPSHCRWKSLLDNLLCQALTIAKISNEIDFKEITAISQKVLQESNKLLAPRHKPDTPSVNKHLTDSLAGDLVTLEQRVNTAVLKLVLQVFTDSNKPMRNLVSACGKKHNTERSPSSLEMLVNDLDIHSDRIFHIGTFAMACSEDCQRIQGISCCLASLESLDNYLVPAITAFYLDNQHPGKRAFVKFLTLHWQQEIATIQTLLDGIIDSMAFCQVCLEDISEKLQKLKKDYVDRKTLDIDLLNSLVKVGQKLYSHLEYNKLTMNIDSQLIQGISIALNECDAAVHLYISSTQGIEMKSVIKRCELLMVNIQKMSIHFSQVVNSPGALNLTSTTDFPESVRDLPLDISENSKMKFDFSGAAWIKTKYLSQIQKCKIAEENEESSNNLEVLKPYLSCVAERNNTFYVKTPCVSAPCVDMEITIPLDNQESNYLDISDILDNLTSLSDTLFSIRTTYNNISTKYEDKKSTSQSISCCANQDSSSIKYEMTKYKILSACMNSQMSSTSVKTGEISDINTPDRLQDLKSVEAKIEMLKLGNV